MIIFNRFTLEYFLYNSDLHFSAWLWALELRTWHEQILCSWAVQLSPVQPATVHRQWNSLLSKENLQLCGRLLLSFMPCLETAPSFDGFWNFQTFKCQIRKYLINPLRFDVFSYTKWINSMPFNFCQDFKLIFLHNFMKNIKLNSCCHLHVKIRLRTAPSYCNFRHFSAADSFLFQCQSYKVKTSRLVISVYHKMPHITWWILLYDG